MFESPEVKVLYGNWVSSSLSSFSTPSLPSLSPRSQTLGAPKHSVSGGICPFPCPYIWVWISPSLLQLGMYMLCSYASCRQHHRDSQTPPRAFSFLTLLLQKHWAVTIYALPKSLGESYARKWVWWEDLSRHRVLRSGSQGRAFQD